MKRQTLLILSAILIVFSIIGIIDAGYLSWEHYHGVIPPCSTASWFPDCGKVLTSSYSSLFGIPLAYLGFIHYSIEFILFSIAFLTQKRWAKMAAVFFGTAGVVMSLYFVWVMVAILGAICQYCLFSALISFAIGTLVHLVYPNERRYWVIALLSVFYGKIAKPLFFLIDPENIHVTMVAVGRVLGRVPGVYHLFQWLFCVRDNRLSQQIAGISFVSPVGLAAGFDYEAQLTQILGSLGFGFQSVGTITRGSYEGNPRPMLGRLPKSKSLMVNKGFKNLGVVATMRALSGLKFPIPVGISVGRTNSVTVATQEKSIRDICSTFRHIESSRVAHAYYELNISCPNLVGNVSFYPAKNLDRLLTAVDALHIKKPLFIKMPIDRTDAEFRSMLRVIAKHSPVGIIIGNLATNRKNPALDKTELKKFPVGNFSGKPTFNRSNELISYAYRTYKKRFIIIGCGGIFSARDAYEKIRRGASVVQLITGMIFEGPQLIGSINDGLLTLLEKDGFSRLSDAIGTKTSVIK